MKVGLLWVLAGSVVLGLLVALVVTWPRHHGAFAPGPSSPKLMVLHGWKEGGPLSQVRGTLDVNDRGCLTIGGDVVVAQEGSRVLPDGEQVVFRGDVAVDLGSHVGGAGGQLGTLQEIRALDLNGAFVQAVARCLRGSPDGEAVQYWLPQPD